MAPAAAAKKSGGTEYLILKAVEVTLANKPPQKFYLPQGVATSHGAKAAARHVVPNPEERVEYVAVPTSNWTALEPSVKQRDPIVEWEEFDFDLPPAPPQTAEEAAAAIEGDDDEDDGA